MLRLTTAAVFTLLLVTAAAANQSLSGVIGPLVAKVQEIQKACGSKILSTIDARGSKSNHRLGRAVDMGGNPRCIYAHLQGWQGGYSTDYSTVRCSDRKRGVVACPHVHISYNPGGQEWGLRFAHRAPNGGKRVRLAHAVAVHHQERAP